MYQLSDANSDLKSYAAQTHTFWNYFQIVTAAVVGFAVSEDISVEATGLLIAFYVVFSFYNGRLVAESQKAARDISDAIALYVLRVKAEIPPELLTCISVYTPQLPGKVRRLHTVIAVAAIVIVSIVQLRK